jgi:ABC-type bacteriocin/lantibiotic exporter with double-glycine peptidase domain
MQPKIMLFDEPTSALAYASAGYRLYLGDWTHRWIIRVSSLSSTTVSTARRGR